MRTDPYELEVQVHLDGSVSMVPTHDEGDSYYLPAVVALDAIADVVRDATDASTAFLRIAAIVQSTGRNVDDPGLDELDDEVTDVDRKDNHHVGRYAQPSAIPDGVRGAIAQARLHLRPEQVANECPYHSEFDENCERCRKARYEETH